jgi:glycosyltransferase involved in cell wall biosynthesis
MAALPDGRLTVIDGLGGGVLPDLLARHAGRLGLVALVHHPLCDETGIDADSAARFAESERAALTHARRVIVTSPSTARRLADFGVPASRIGTVLPGTDPAAPAKGSEGPGLNMLCVASLTPRKGHAVLVDALAGLTDRAWHLTLVGGDRSPETAAALRTQIAEAGLEERVTFAGELPPDGVAAAYHKADLFVLPSHYEGFGMVISEAIVRRLPIVTTTGGALAETLPAEAGLAVPPGDAPALHDALARVLDEPALHRRLAEGAMAARARFPDWPTQAQAFADELDRVPR